MIVARRKALFGDDGDARRLRARIRARHGRRDRRQRASGLPGAAIPLATGGDIYAPWEYGPTAFDERHRVTLSGVLPLRSGSRCRRRWWRPRRGPYTQNRMPNPSGDGNLRVLCPSENNENVGFGAGQVPCEVNNARGLPLFNINARITKNFTLQQHAAIGDIRGALQPDNRPPFGNQLGGNQQAPTTYNLPVVIWAERARWRRCPTRSRRSSARGCPSKQQRYNKTHTSHTLSLPSHYPLTTLSLPLSLPSHYPLTTLLSFCLTSHSPHICFRARSDPERGSAPCDARRWPSLLPPRSPRVCGRTRAGKRPGRWRSTH